MATLQPTSSRDVHDLRLAAFSAAAGARRIMVVTDNGHGFPFTRARRAAIGLAGTVGAELILYDRSAESRFVSAYPEGGFLPGLDGTPGECLLGRDVLESLGRSYLAAQLREAEDAGVRAQAWLPLHCGHRGLRECIERFRVDLLVVPESLGSHPILLGMRRRSADKLDAFAIPTLVVGADGAVRRARTWRLEPETSSLKFSATQLRWLPVRGRFEDFSVDLRYDDIAPERSSMETVIAAASIRTGIRLRDRQLRSSRFLDCSAFPIIRFRSEGIDPLDTGFRIMGELTIRAQSVPVILDAQIEPMPAHASPHRRVRFRARTSVSWRDWGIKGVSWVGPRLGIDIDVVAVQLPRYEGNSAVTSFSYGGYDRAPIPD
jgi:polyisoprenoid-binding protein YceI